MGRSGAGKTTLTQALYGEDIEYHKTQYVNYSEYIIDPPGEYIEDKQFGFALALYSYADKSPGRGQESRQRMVRDCGLRKSLFRRLGNARRVRRVDKLSRLERIVTSRKTTLLVDSSQVCSK